MRKYQSALAIGIFLGIIVVMNFQMLILFAISVSHQQQSDEYSSKESQGEICSFTPQFMLTSLMNLFIYLCVYYVLHPSHQILLDLREL